MGIASTDRSSFDHRWRLHAAVPLLVLVAGIVGWNASAFVVDESGLQQHPESWGYAFGSVISTVMYGAAPLLLALGAALGAQVSGPRGAAPWVWAGAVVDALCAAALVVAAVLVAQEDPAGVAFGAATLVVALALFAPLGLCIRRRRSDRSGATSAVSAA